MTRQTRNLRKDKLLRQWSAVLNHLERGGRVAGVVQVWQEAEGVLRQLRAMEQEERDGEMEFVYTDLSKKYPQDMTALCVMAVLLTMLADAAESVERADENPHRASCLAIMSIFHKDEKFQALIDAFFARRTDNQLRPVVLPVKDYLQEVGEAEEEEAEPLMPLEGISLEECYEMATLQPDIQRAKPYIELFYRNGHREWGDKVQNYFSKIEQQRTNTHIEQVVGTVHGDAQQQLQLGNISTQAPKIDKK